MGDPQCTLSRVLEKAARHPNPETLNVALRVAQEIRTTELLRSEILDKELRLKELEVELLRQRNQPVVNGMFIDDGSRESVTATQWSRVPATDKFAMQEQLTQAPTQLWIHAPVGPPAVSTDLELGNSMSYPEQWPPERMTWDDSHHAFLTFGMEDFGYMHMPRGRMSFCTEPNAALCAAPPVPVSLEATVPLYPLCAQREPGPLVQPADVALSAQPEHAADFSPYAQPIVTEPTRQPPRSQSRLKQKKQILEEEAKCRVCKQPVAVYLLHEKDCSPNIHYLIDIVCSTCQPSIQSRGLVPRSRKRSEVPREEELAVCEVCKRRVGIGSIKPLDERHQKDPYADPDIVVEVICCHCRSKYALCTECGGGGKHRTGKWRPLELFQAGRKTCRLPHVRISSSPIMFQEWVVPTSLAADLGARSMLLAGIDKSVPHMYYHRLAIPEVMELDPPNELATFEQLTIRVKGRCQHLREFVLGSDTESTHKVRKYVGAAWMERVSRHSKKASGSGKVHISASSPGQPTIMVAICVMWWDMVTGCIRLAALQALNTEFSKGSILFRMTRRVVDSILADRNTMVKADPNNNSLPSVEIFGLPVFEEFARLPAVQHTLGRLGFIPLDEFESSHPEMDCALIERALLDKEGLFGGVPAYKRCLFVGSVRQLLAGPWGREGQSSTTRATEQEMVQTLSTARES